MHKVLTLNSDSRLSCVWTDCVGLKDTYVNLFSVFGVGPRLWSEGLLFEWKMDVKCFEWTVLIQTQRVTDQNKVWSFSF